MTIVLDLNLQIKISAKICAILSVMTGARTSLAANKDQNFWYKVPEGNPITILRNGQGRQVNQEGWIPTVEDINRDASSIYLTHGQIIVIDDIQNNQSK